MDLYGKLTADPPKVSPKKSHRSASLVVDGTEGADDHPENKDSAYLAGSKKAPR
jgi:hypothetical protein